MSAPCAPSVYIAVRTPGCAADRSGYVAADGLFTADRRRAERWTRGFKVNRAIADFVTDARKGIGPFPPGSIFTAVVA